MDNIINLSDSKFKKGFLLSVSDDYSNNYWELLQSSDSDLTETQRLRFIAFEDFKTLNGRNSNLMKEIFRCSP